MISQSDETEDEVTTRVHVYLEAVCRWVLQNGTYVQVLSLKSLVNDIILVEKVKLTRSTAKDV